jgi:hypothetical protein
MIEQPNTGKSPQVQIPSLAKTLLAESEKQGSELTPVQDAGKFDSGNFAHTDQTNYAEIAKRNFDQKIYMFPESYNALRRELHEYWPHLWSYVSWAMANRAELFVERMNDALDLKVNFDSQKVDAICTIYLDALQTTRNKTVYLQWIDRQAHNAKVDQKKQEKIERKAVGGAAHE